MDAASVATVIGAGLVGIAGIVVGVVKAMRGKAEAELVQCAYDGDQVKEQTGLLRDIRDGIVALKYELTAQRDLASRTCSSVDALHRRMDAIIESRKP